MARRTADERREHVLGQLQAYAAAGATRAYLQVLDLDGLDDIALLAAEVLPQVA